MKHFPENNLAEEFKRGDRQAFERVFEQFYRQLLVFAVGIVQDEKEAEDIVISTMTKLWKRHQNFDSLVNIRAFLYITVRNQSFNFLKSKKVKDKYINEATYLHSGDNDSLLVQYMVELELLEMIRREIEALSPQRKLILQMFYFERLSLNEIAEKLQLSKNTVSVTKSEAVKQLKTIIFRKQLLELWMFILTLKATQYGVF